MMGASGPGKRKLTGAVLRVRWKMEVHRELLDKLPNGLPRVSEYNEFLRITKQADTSDMFVAWIQVAYILMRDPAGAA
jgi:hypothetical protein